jgi:ArsR family transcriptional regulator, arsenate/arsenite/antimonite-responsive transcriptional repressor
MKPKDMKPSDVVAALAAIAHDHRLAVYRLLVERGPNGVSAGEIAQRLGMPPSSLTFHLQQMLHAGLVSQRRLGRQIIYAADYAAMDALVGYLTENCCGSEAQCGPVCNPAPAVSKIRKQRRSS